MHTTYILSALALALPVYSSAGMGCYSEIGSLKSQGPYTFQSPGYCKNTCSRKGFKVAALSRGDMCYCGNDTPSQSAKVDDDQCNQVCSGYPGTKCGGNNAYTLIQGTEVGEADDDSDPNQSSNAAAPTAATAAGGIVVAPSTAPAPTGIVTAASSINSKSANAASKTVTSATTAVTSTATPTPSDSAAGTIRAASPLIGAVVAAMGLLL